MSEEQKIVVPVCGCGGTVEVDVEDGMFYVFGIYDDAGEPVADMLLNTEEASELASKLAAALGRVG